MKNKLIAEINKYVNQWSKDSINYKLIYQMNSH